MNIAERPYSRTASSPVLGLCFVALAFATAGCASLPQSTPASARTASYLAAHPELTRDVSRAIENGRLLLGMNIAQVAAVIGEPDRRTRFDATGSEVWLYRAGRAHLNQLPDGVQAFRLAFEKNRLVLIEPF